jgi:hypothetical protein
MKKHHLEDQAVEILAISLTTDKTNTFDSFMNMAGCKNIFGYSTIYYNFFKLIPHMITKDINFSFSQHYELRQDIMIL